MAEYLYVKAGGDYNYHCALKGQVGSFKMGVQKMLNLATFSERGLKATRRNDGIARQASLWIALAATSAPRKLSGVHRKAEEHCCLKRSSNLWALHRRSLAQRA
jgi:hypothetical protein